MKGYKIDFNANKLIATKRFYEKAMIPETEEYTTLLTLKNDFPNIRICVKDATGAKVRAIEYSLMQRCAAHVASKTDVDEAVLMGAEGVRAAVAGMTDKMVAISRDPDAEGYVAKVEMLPLTVVANTEKKFPLEWITEDGAGIKKDFFDYALPLIAGENPYTWEQGLPRFANLKKIKAE